MLHVNPLPAFLLVLSMLLCACHPIVAPIEDVTTQIEPPSLDPAVAAELEALVGQKMEELQVPGVALAIVKDGALQYAKGFGVTELDTQQAVTPDSIFHLASVSKTVVGVAVMQLVEEGKIDLDVPVSDYLPYFTVDDPAADQVTVKQLLTHTSGLPNVEDWITEYRYKEQRYDEQALEDQVRSLATVWLLNRPGEEFSYSNNGFAVLGDLIAKVSGQSFEEYMTEYLFAPLGMDHSTFAHFDSDPELMATPHLYDYQSNVEISDFFPYSRSYAPGSAMDASLNDLAHFATALLNQGELDGVRILDAETLDAMWTPQVATGMDQYLGSMMYDYGLGWWLGEVAGHRTVGGHGADAGFQTALILLPDDAAAVIALVNLYDPVNGDTPAFDLGLATTEKLVSIDQ